MVANNVYKHFGLTGPPFAVSPDPRFAYGTAEHNLAILKINYSVENRRGLFLLQGAVGTGKTTLARFLMSQWTTGGIICAHVGTPVTRSQAGFLREIMGAFGIPTTRNLSGLTEGLLAFLLEARKQDKVVVLMLDDAQFIAPPNLDILHSISNMQTLTEQLMQIVLLAQPNITHKLEQKPALQSRITGGTYLGPLSFEDAGEMLAHRVAVAGGDFNRVFAPDALHPIYDATQGICRDLCVCADAALVQAYARGHKTITGATITEVTREMRFKGWQIK